MMVLQEMFLDLMVASSRGQPRQIDRGRLIQDEVDMPGQRTVVDLVCTVVKGLEHLGIKQTYQKVIGIVIGPG